MRSETDCAEGAANWRRINANKEGAAINLMYWSVSEAKVRL